MSKFFLSLWFLLLLILPVSAEEFSFDDFSGGLNDKYSNTLIANNEASAIRNIDLSVNRGTITKRKGYTPVCTIQVVTGYEINGLFDYQVGDSSSYIIACSSATITKLAAGDTSWTVISPTSDIASGSYYDFCTFNSSTDGTDILVITDGTSVPMKYNGGASVGQIGTGTDPDDRRPNYAEFVEKYKNRLYFGGKMQEADGGVAGSVTYNRVRYSGDYGAPNVVEGANAWPADWFMTIADEKITGMINYNGALVITGIDSINEIRGDFYASYDSLVIRQVIKGVGCISNRTLKVIDNDLYFLDRSGHVYSYNGAGVTLRSDKIATTIAGLNTGQLTKAVAEYYPAKHQYWLSVPNGSSSTNNLILVYDTLLNAWSVLSGINASCLALVERSNSLYLYSGDSTAGYVYFQDNGNIDYPLNVATGIDAYYTTKYFSLPSTEREKIYDSVYVVLEQTGNYNLIATNKFDFGKSQLTQNILLASENPKWNQARWNQAKWGGENTIVIEKLSLHQAANFMNLTFTNSNYSQPFKIYGFSFRAKSLELR